MLHVKRSLKAKQKTSWMLVLVWLNEAQQYVCANIKPPKFVNMLFGGREAIRCFTSKHYHHAHGWRKIFSFAYLKLHHICSVHYSLSCSVSSLLLQHNAKLSPSVFVRWAGGIWGCWVSLPKRPPIWMQWLLRACSSPTSTQPTHFVPHVSQQKSSQKTDLYSAQTVSAQPLSCWFLYFTFTAMN